MQVETPKEESKEVKEVKAKAVLSAGRQSVHIIYLTPFFYACRLYRPSGLGLAIRSHLLDSSVVSMQEPKAQGVYSPTVIGSQIAVLD